MRRFCLPILVTGLLVLVLTAAPAWAQRGPTPTPDPFGRDPKQEQQFLDKLAKMNQQAVAPFKQGTAEMDRNDYQDAAKDLLLAHTLAPQDDDALRRLSYAELGEGKNDDALTHARAAVQLNNSAFNNTALADALLQQKTNASNAEALQVAWTAIKLDSNDPSAALILAEAGIANKDTSAISQSAGILQRVAPDLAQTHFVLALDAMGRNDSLQADAELTRAEQAGMPSDTIEPLREQSGVASSARFYRTLIGGGYGLIGWLVGFIVLMVVGGLLSNLTLSAVRHMKPEATVRVSPAERTIRAVYRFVIVIGSVYFYISIPLILLITIALAGAVIYMFLEIGFIPIQFTIILALGTLYTLVTVVRSLFVRFKQVDPGPRITREAAPQLWALVEEVAARVDTRPVDVIFATPTTEISVAERGRGLAGLGRQPERVLTLGLGSLNGMTIGPFKAVIAHEYGHFSNRDTAGGSLALRVRASIFQMARGLTMQRQNNWLNPVWLFLVGYSRLFSRITLGASRLQEILADRTAALTYGATNLAEALEHIVRAAFQFGLVANTELRQAYQLKRPVANLYALQVPEDATSSKALDEQIRKEMSRPTSPYDSHPAMKDRLELIRALEPVASGERNNKAVWDLLPNAQELQVQMSQALYQRATSGR